MAAIEIRDLEVSLELDRAAMQRIYGGSKGAPRSGRGLRTGSLLPRRRRLLADEQPGMRVGRG